MIEHETTVTASAPASVGNVAVGFDLLGHALEGPRDFVSATRCDTTGVVIERIHGVTSQLPLDPRRNTASRAVMALLAKHAPEAGVALVIDKGIPLASGLGGSAASAVAAVVAVNELLELGLSHAELYPYALAGEAVASGAAHGDNVGCQLLGGLVLATADRLIPVPVPHGLICVAVHPEYRVNTRDARQCLQAPFELATVVEQSANLAQVLCGCHQSRLELIAAGLADVMVEPRRAGLIPGFAQVRQAALDHNALGASISGAGPTVFGWFAAQDHAESACAAMRRAFADAGLEATGWISPVDAPGARIEES
ncbi:MAG: homoserine kinase [Wenzhouxiangellaceae bacterium]